MLLILSDENLRKKNNRSDTILINRVQQGDTSSFRGLVEKYKDVSFSLACSIVKDETLAEDVLQDAFIKVFRNIKKFQGKSAFSTWLYRIVVNTCYDAIRKNKSLNNVELSEREYNISDFNSGYDSSLRNERISIAREALKKLKPDESLVMRLYYLCELGMDEIKEITGFSESKIKVTLHRGRQSLELVLEKMLGNEINYLL